jgi:hypothetical protein
MSTFTLGIHIHSDERAFVAQARELFQKAATYSEANLTFELDDAPDGEGLFRTLSSDAYLISLRTFLDPVERDWSELHTHLDQQIGTLAQTGKPVFLLTLFRNVPIEDDPAQAARRLVRLRRLNLSAMEVSRLHGVFIVDIDRALADIGALALATDYRLRGDPAARVCAITLGRCLVSNAMDDQLSVTQQDQIRTWWEEDLAAHALVTAPAQIVPTNLMTLGHGRKRQRASTITDTIQENHVGWLVGQFAKGRISPQEALTRFTLAIRRRGAFASLALLAHALRGRLTKART